MSQNKPSSHDIPSTAQAEDEITPLLFLTCDPIHVARVICGEELNAPPFEPMDLIATRYRVMKTLGQGGQGTVYKAVDEMTGVLVAIKVLPRSLQHDDLLWENLKHEFLINQRLQHPNIVSTRQIEEDPPWRFLVMEMVEGQTLRRVLKEDTIDGRLPLDQIADIFLQIARGLHEAHINGIIHRDIKPENIIVSTDGVVKLLDFGIAWQMAKRLNEENDGPKHKKIPGTPRYMSPEQVKGEELDHRTDIYSMSVLIFEMLTGHSPYAQGTELGLQILYHEPDPIMEYSKPINDVMAWGLEKNRKDRPDSILEMAEAFSQAADLNRQLPSLTEDLKNFAKNEEKQTRRLQQILIASLCAVFFMIGILSVVIIKNISGSAMDEKIRRVTLDQVSQFPTERIQTQGIIVLPLGNPYNTRFLISSLNNPEQTRVWVDLYDTPENDAGLALSKEGTIIEINGIVGRFEENSTIIGSFSRDIKILKK